MPNEIKFCCNCRYFNENPNYGISYCEAPQLGYGIDFINGKYKVTKNIYDKDYP